MYSPSVNDLLQPYKQYPRTIQRAILLVETSPRFLGLTKCMKAVVKTLLTRASQTNGTTPFKARLDRVAMQAGVSNKTVQRTIATLRLAGWMEQVSDGRSNMGVFTFRSYRFTKVFCKLVGLPTDSKVNRNTEMTDGGVYVDLSFREDHAKISKEKRQGKPVDLPPALHEITALGVKDTGVAKLRGMAHDAGHRLEDIWQAGKACIAIAGATGGRLYLYLQAMIKVACDYAARASQVERNGTQAIPKARTISRWMQCAHKRYSAGARTVVQIYEGIAEVLRDGQWIGNIAGRDMEKVYDDIENGKLILKLA